MMNNFFAGKGKIIIIVAIFLVLLVTGGVLFYSYYNNAQLRDPSSTSATDNPYSEPVNVNITLNASSVGVVYSGFGSGPHSTMVDINVQWNNGTTTNRHENRYNFEGDSFSLNITNNNLCPTWVQVHGTNEHPTQDCDSPQPTPTPTSTTPATSTPKPTTTPKPTATATLQATVTPTPLPTSTPPIGGPSSTPTPVPTASPTPSPTPSPTTVAQVTSSPGSTNPPSVAQDNSTPAPDNKQVAANTSQELPEAGTEVSIYILTFGIVFLSLALLINRKRYS